jgi:competence ComEA-like helix-hairpin-helix protein
MTRREQWALIGTIGVIIGAFVIRGARERDSGGLVHVEGQGYWQRIATLETNGTQASFRGPIDRPAAEPGGAPPAGRVDAAVELNAATAEDLDRLPGIGPVKAAAILATRERLGGFASVDQLTEVRGIGPATVEKLRPYVRVSQPQDRDSGAGAGVGQVVTAGRAAEEARAGTSADEPTPTDRGPLDPALGLAAPPP